MARGEAEPEKLAPSSDLRLEAEEDTGGGPFMRREGTMWPGTPTSNASTGNTR